ncbi:MAG: 30S ribosomal protein S7 [Actinobacteria bacterium QS_5_72_10]|nr:MAG: 30S ribosomal protein S7 [Actinobacteria bacterium QS_8_72_14]PSO51249.1 MAG: 30S ribosomal protein S7 [Actinobacteria bacterium QS_5_72_10]
MPRKGPVSPRKPTPDPVYHSTLVAQLTSHIMEDGKRTKAERIVYGAFDLVAQRTDGDPVQVFRRAVDNVRPQMEVKSRRVGGATYQVPIEVKQSRATTLALRWLTQYARNRREHSMVERLGAEMMDAANNTGAAVKRRDDTHRMAEANKAFAHYRW